MDAEKQDMPTVGTAAYAQNGATTAGNKKEVTVALPTYTSVGEIPSPTNLYSFSNVTVPPFAGV